MWKKRAVIVVIMLVFTALVPFFIVNCGIGRDDSAIVEKEEVLAGRSGINLEIEKLREELKNAPDDHTRAVKSSKIAELQSAKGNTGASLEYARQAVKYQPNLYMARYLLGKAYMELGRYGDAETEFRKSIEFRNDFAPSHFELGNALYKKYNFNGAITEYRAAIRLDPEHFQAMNNIASVYVEARKYSEAEKVLKEAVRLKPDFAVGYKNLGVLYETRLNNKTLALEFYGKYLKARPDSADRDIVKSWIRTLGGRS